MTDRFVTVPDSLEIPADVKVPSARLSDSTAAGRALLDAADAATQRTALGLGTAATTPATDYATAAQGAKADAGDVDQITLTGNLALTIPEGHPAGQVYRCAITQTTGGHTVTYGGQPVTVDLTAGAVTTVELHPAGAGYVVTYPPKVALGTAATTDATDYATAAQGVTADSAARSIRLSGVAVADGACGADTASMSAGSPTLTLAPWAARLTVAHVGKTIAVEGAGDPLVTTLAAPIRPLAQPTNITVPALEEPIPSGKLTISEGANSVTLFHGPAPAGATSIVVTKTGMPSGYTVAAVVTIARPLVTTVATVDSATQATLAAPAGAATANAGWVVGTDNTAAIQSAINTAGFAHVVVDGCFVTGPLVVPARTTIQGVGADGMFPIGTTTAGAGFALKADGNGPVLTSTAGAQFVNIRDIRIDGNGWAQTVAGAGIAVPNFGASREVHWNIENVFVGWTSGDAISLGNLTRGTQVTNSYCYRAAGSGIRVDGTDNVLERVFIGACLADGVRGAGAANVVHGANIWGNYNGVYLGGTRAWQVLGCYIDANRNAGLFISNCKSMVLSGNKFTPNSAAGTGGASNIMLRSASSDILIGDNLHYSPTPGAWGYLPVYAVDAEEGTAWVDGGGTHVGDLAVATSAIGGAGTRTLTASVAASMEVKHDKALAESDLLSVGQETFTRSLASGNLTSLTGELILSYFTARKSETASKVVTTVTNVAASATPTLCRVGIYEVADNGDLTLVASSANDVTLWVGSTFAEYESALSAPYAVAAGSRYAVGRLCVTAGTAPNMAAASSNLPSATTLARAPRLTGKVAAQADIPASISAAAVLGTGGRHWAALVP